jgi:hypothetical protein
MATPIYTFSTYGNASPQPRQSTLGLPMCASFQKERMKVMFHLQQPFYTVHMPTEVILSSPHLAWHLAATICRSGSPYTTARIRTCSVLCLVAMIEISSQIERTSWRAYSRDVTMFVFAADVIFVVLSVVPYGAC